jgi:hypothetical protein
VFDELAVAATGIETVDARLHGGFPRGQLSEAIGRPSSGRTSFLLHTIAAALSRGELVALVDALDVLDVESAVAAGIDLDRLLWIRGHVVVNPGFCRDTNQRAIEQAVKAVSLVLQAGNFGLVVLDLADAPHDGVRRLPFTTWLRLQRMVEGTHTACLLIGSEPMARSAAGLTLRLQQSAVGSHSVGSDSVGNRFTGRLFDGLDVSASVVRARAHASHETAAIFSTDARLSVQPLIPNPESRMPRPSNPQPPTPHPWREHASVQSPTPNP